MVYIENAAYYAGTKLPTSKQIGNIPTVVTSLESCRSDLCQPSYYLEITYWDLHKMRTDFFLI